MEVAGPFVLLPSFKGLLRRLRVSKRFTVFRPASQEPTIFVSLGYAK